MTKTYEYTFLMWQKKEGTDGKRPTDWVEVPITLRKRVTDKMEERNGCHKAGYAAQYFNRVLRTQYGYKTSPVTAMKIREV